MQRRDFLKTFGALLGLGVGGYALGASLRPGAPDWRAALDSGGCVTPGTDLSALRRVAAQRASGALAYQGTHILTYGAFRELSTHYSRDTGAEFIVHGGGCDDGIAALRLRSADLGGLCCPVEGSRAEGMRWLSVAKDMKVVITHPSVDIPDVSLDALRDLARGRVSRWGELGGEDRAIALIYREHCPDLFEPVRDILLANRPDWSPRGISVDTDQQLVDLVARFPGAVCVVSWVFAEPLVAQGRVRLLSVDGVSPTLEEAAAGRYPLMGPLNVVLGEWRAEVMEPFFDYLYGPRGREVVGRLLVPVSAEEAGYRAAARSI
ncbi:substrate-binding domain-containing protein [Thioalkalivibrio sulfidiphilus]|uniref:substrate-binding domain-containing protein n=1 Tax=Thioalkalivibrio sulfidiphilus TaxID=1033854 RepID=UPI0003A1385E|nr:substrate-binding domain-containing protein [Thioalkalivibrio sulfidiphilus]